MRSCRRNRNVLQISRALISLSSSRKHRMNPTDRLNPRSSLIHNENNHRLRFYDTILFCCIGPRNLRARASCIDRMNLYGSVPRSHRIARLSRRRGCRLGGDPAPGQPFPHAVSSISGSVVNTTFTYDANGNQAGGNGLTLTYASFKAYV